MMLLGDLALRSSALLGVSLIACVVLARRSAALRHAVLTAALVAAFAILPAAWLLPSWNVPRPIADAIAIFVNQSIRLKPDPTNAPDPTNEPDRTNEPDPTSEAAVARDAVAVASVGPVGLVGNDAAVPAWSAVVIGVWGAGTIMSLMWLLAGVVRLRRITHRASRLTPARWEKQLVARTAREYGIAVPAVLLTDDAPGLVATWGWWTPCILMPIRAAEWPQARLRAVLGHECGHIRRRDWLVQMIADVFRSICWFNPIAWVVCARLRRECDLACDDLVLARGVPAPVYASQLIDIVRECRTPVCVPAMSMAHRVGLEGRITAMLNPHVDRRVPTRRAAALLGVVLIALLLPLASFTLTAQAQTEPAALTGNVYDPSGGVLPGVAVVLQDSAQNSTKTTTDGGGRFQFPAVAPGRYVISVSLPGFRSLRNEFELSTRAQWTRAITLQVGTIEETVTVQAARRPAAAASATPAGRPVVRVGGAIRPPKKVSSANPVYPPAMQDAGLEGVVPLQAIIGTDGQVLQVRVLSAEVHPEFVRAATEAVRQWRFTPTLLNGAPVAVMMDVTVLFSLAAQ